MSDDFFDPNSLEAAPVAKPEDPNSAHRLEGTFDDPLSLFNFTAPSVEVAPDAIQPEVPAEFSITQEATEAINDLLFASPPSAPPVAAAEFVATPIMDVATPLEGGTDTSIGLAADAGENSETEHLGAKIRLYEELQTLVLCEHSFDVLVEKGLQALMRGLGAQVGSILEFDHAKEDFFFRASRGGAADKVRSFRIPSKKGIVGFVSESGQALLINDLQDDERQLKSISVTVGFEARSCLAAPITIAGKLYGVVEVFNRLGTVYFKERDKALLVDGVAAFAKALEVRFFMAELITKKANG